MIGARRKLIPFEKNFINTNERIQFAIEVEKPSAVPKVVENLRNALLGFDLHIEGDYLVHRKNAIEVNKMPSSVQSCLEAATFVDSEVPLDYSERLCSISANDRFIGVSVSHMIYDGGFFLTLYDKLFESSIFRTSEPLPLTTYDIFQDTFSNLPPKLENEPNTTTVLNWSHKPDPNVSPTENCKYLAIETPADECLFLKNKFGLTEYYWTMIPLSVMAMNGKIQEFGIASCVDLRQEMKNKEFSHTVSNNFIEINLPLKGTNPNHSIRQIGKMFREKFNEYKSTGQFYHTFNLMNGGFPSLSEPVAMCGISNVGRFLLKPPIVDCWIQQTMRCKCVESFAPFIGFSKNKYGRNTLVTRFQQPQSVINDEDAKILLESVVYSLKEIHPDMTVQEAFDNLRKFQSKIRIMSKTTF
ncbi:hypothetical protein TRFO_36097 [Tritrichomonas foetus]|uniref:Condensation domain-containing protein n=1 Tax=Tritrichomonas foetus TaxID=1144522 RepID=A0A1J4JK97_9EUKA|nr:hypothetical protein TRFO_36097 [Tritrichomonas foetus]|eukprot:OHS97668.1 hypothetical protein TRFO_36097 [Tritrichomonas foetus]